MKNWILLSILLVVIQGGQTSALAATTKPRTEWKMPPSTIESIRPYYKNNVRIFPFSYWVSALHGAYERGLARHWAIGAEANFMFRPWYSGFLGDNIYSSHEDYFGVLGQYYTKEVFDGFHIEGGLSYVSATIGSTYEDREYSRASFLMPHAVVGYRFTTPGIKGLNFGAGIGVYTYMFGKSLEYYDHNQLTVAEGYRTGVPYLRLRLDVGYSF
jgi:hypothetical protein